MASARDRDRVREHDRAHREQSSGYGADVVAVRASTIKPGTVRWLWRGWIPLGMQSALIGVPGQGKSTLAMTIAALATRGELPGDLHGTPSHVQMISYEDVLAERLRPMAEAAGADLDRLDFLKCRQTGYVIDLTAHLARIEAFAARTQARLLVIDPLVAGMPSGKVDTHRDNAVRSVLAPIAALAEKQDMSVMTIGHFSKGAMSALLGTGGSIGFIGAPRSILAFGPDPRAEAKEEDRVLAHAKSNVGKLQASLEVRVIGDFIGDVFGGNGIETSRTVLGDECDVAADDLVQVAPTKETPKEQAQRFLRELLADGPHAASEVYALAEDDGISVRTLKRAKEDLAIEAYQAGRQWFWKLPAFEEAADDGDD